MSLSSAAEFKLAAFVFDWWYANHANNHPNTGQIHHQSERLAAGETIVSMMTIYEKSCCHAAGTLKWH
jgi:hypothetical protein